MHAWGEYQLVDFGGGARLERFGDEMVDRPHPAALGARRDVDAWRDADLRFDRDRGWTGSAAHRASWPIRLDALSMELRPTEAGQLGLFPEHLSMLPWLTARVTDLAPAGPSRYREGQAPAVLHLFAYTGLATLAMAAAGAEVTHVDGARPTVAWARRNAELSHLQDKRIRWILDDALGFTEREARRDRRYAGVVLDPPSHGHGPAGQPWHLEDQLGALLEAVGRILEPDGFVLMTAHTSDFNGDRLAADLSLALSRPAGRFERGELAISTGDGRRLDLGSFARWPGGAS